MQAVTISLLKTFEALKNIPDNELQWLIDNSKQYELQDCELLTNQGQPSVLYTNTWQKFKIKLPSKA
jgi:hypothetical protein